jgi:hypothetical protein
MERKQRTRFWQRDNSAHAYGERIGELDLQLKATSRHDRAMSALPLKPDIDGRGYNVRFVPKADIAAFSAYNNPATSRTRRSGFVIGAKRARTTPVCCCLSQT